MKVCTGEILYAAAYGGMYDCTFVNSVTVTPVWLETVKEREYVVCDINDTLWLDFNLNSSDVFGNTSDEENVDPILYFVRKYCYKRICENYSEYFGMTEIFSFLYRTFSPKYKEPPDVYDEVYANFVDSLLNDVRFIVCVKLAESPQKTNVCGVQDTEIGPSMEPEVNTTSACFKQKETCQRKVERSNSLNSSEFTFEDFNDHDFEEDFIEDIQNINTYSEHTPLATSSIKNTTPEQYNNGKTIFDRIPLIMIYDSDASTFALPYYEYTNRISLSERDPQLFKPGTVGTFVLEGLYTEKSTARDHVTVEIIYSVRLDSDKVTFTAIDVTNKYLDEHTKRGRIRLELSNLTKVLQHASLDPGMRLIDSTRFDPILFQVLPSSIGQKVFWESTKKIYLRFLN